MSSLNLEIKIWLALEIRIKHKREIKNICLFGAYNKPGLFIRILFSFNQQNNPMG